MACKAFTQKCWSSTIAKAGHDGTALPGMKILSARPGWIKTSLPIEQRHVNNHNTIHGGAILSMTDTVTSLAISTMGYPPPTGVSVNISTEFVRPGGKKGDEIIGIGEIVKMGRTMAYTKVTFYTPDDKIVAFGSHTKHMATAKQTTSFTADGEEERPLEQAKL